MLTVHGVVVTGRIEPEWQRLLTDDALAFVAELHRRFDRRRHELLVRRAERQKRMNAGELPRFRDDTRHIRAGNWQVWPAPPDLTDRRVEITGPVDRKMMINALNSGANCFMACLEDATAPTLANIMQGHVNLCDAVRRTLRWEGPDGRSYTLNERPATLLVRPRGWHLTEKHVLVEGEPIAAALFDAGMYLYHNARELVAHGSGPYFYLPKLEGADEAALWHDVFAHAEDALDLETGTVRATVLIETIVAAFEMDEMLHALGPYASGLNAGRWDYIFSVIKKFRERPDFVLPDRSDVTMTVPFMHAYTELLVATCHRRGAHAIGGMAAFIPSRRDPAVNEVALVKVREDKEREAAAGCDGTWVAHPDLVPVAKAAFDEVLGGRPHQLERQRPDVQVTAKDLLNVTVPGGQCTEAGLRLNVSVALQYVSAWLCGHGAAAINNMMEDAATAEISRSQVWQWLRHGVTLADGRPVTAELVRQLLREETDKLREAAGEQVFRDRRGPEAAELLAELIFSDEFEEFLTVPAYARLD